MKDAQCRETGVLALFQRDKGAAHLVQICETLRVADWHKALLKLQREIKIDAIINLIIPAS
jgi:hypothetical protein